MAYVNSWSSKEEVLKDLARASGRRYNKRKENLDEAYLLYGDAPPPVIPENEDDETELLFGNTVGKKAIQIEENAPDLLGIQQMLRMMQDYDNGDDDDVTNDPACKDCVISITKASKLNPNVKEFVPKGTTIPTSDTNGIKHNANNKEIQLNDTKTIDQNSNDLCKVVSDLNVKEKTDKSQKIASLKNKISDAAKSDSFGDIRQKNVAIATLLRLCARNNTSPPVPEKPCARNNTSPPVLGNPCARNNISPPVPEKLLKLIPPDYFEAKKVTSDSIEKAENDTSMHLPTKPAITVSPPLSLTPDLKGTTKIIALSSSTSSTSSLKIKMDPEIKRSIDKVNSWLDEPKSKSPAVCLGPISFKKKESCKSPSSESGSQSQPSQPKTDCKQYQPSPYAADLGKRYLERSKKLEANKHQLTWDNLEDVLKKRDMELKKKLEEQASSRSHS